MWPAIPRPSRPNYLFILSYPYNVEPADELICSRRARFPNSNYIRTSRSRIRLLREGGLVCAHWLAKRQMPRARESWRAVKRLAQNRHLICASAFVSSAVAAICRKYTLPCRRYRDLICQLIYQSFRWTPLIFVVKMGFDPNLGRMRLLMPATFKNRYQTLKKFKR
jgi:hypothetical protein